MEKIDFKVAMKALYGAPQGRFATVDVPSLRYLMVDGQGDPNTAPAYKAAIEWLFSASYAMKFASKQGLGKDYAVPPLEGLWWADDPADFVARRKDRWRWTLMILVPDFVGDEICSAAIGKARAKLGEPPATLRIERLCEGLSLQTLHVGRYDDEGPTLATLHAELMPAQRLEFNGKHHEIYLSDARKTAPAKLRTILRQPVRHAGPSHQALA